MTKTETTTREELGQGVIREWLEDGRIMVMRMPKGAHREAIDVWFETMVEFGNTWDVNIPCRVLHDGRELGYSYYFRERAIEAGKRIPAAMNGRAAMVLPSGVIGSLLTVLAKLSSNAISANVSLKTFNNYDRALEWLKEGL